MIIPSGKLNSLGTGSHGPVEIVSFPIQHGGSFHRFWMFLVCLPGRVHHLLNHR